MGQPGYVYLVQALGTKRYKIGRSLDVNKRLDTLGRQCPFPLKLLASAYVLDYVKEEKRLHELARQYHAHGEWFDLPDSWLRDIKSWFYDSGITRYSGNGIFLVLAPGLPDLSRIDRAIELLGHYAKGQPSVKIKNEIFEILGKLPSSSLEAREMKAALKQDRKKNKSGTGNLDGIL